jgi:hypothetical protein
MMGQFPPPVDDRQIWDIWLSIHHMPAMLAADEIGLFDVLATGPLPIEELASRCQVNARALGITAGLLCALGLLMRRDGRLELTPVSRAYLVKSSSFYWGALIGGFRNSLPIYGLLMSALAPDADHRGGENTQAWDAGSIDPERARDVAAFMHAHSSAAAARAAGHGAFADVTRLLDVGGGSGIFSIAIARAWPHLRATIMDLGTMCEAAMDYVRDAAMTDRVDTVAVDMFRQPWPTGYDAVFFSDIFHDWSDETCTALARKAYDVLPSGGRIFLHEALMNDNLDGPVATASFSILMLTDTQGRQFSLPEFDRMLGQAGFVDCQASATCGYYSLVSARKP